MFIMFKIDLKLFEEYLKLKGLRPRTIREYLYYAIRFNNMGDFNNGTFSTYTITRFLVDKTNLNNVARSFILILKKFLLHYREELKITEEEFKEIVQTEVPSISGRTKVKLNIPLARAEMELMESTLNTEELKLMFLTCYNGGLRLQELMGIKISSFNWDSLKENPEEMGEVRVNGKGGREGICLLPNWLMKRIGIYIRSNSFKNGAESYLFNMTGRNFEIKLREAGIKSGITRKNEKGEYIQNTIVHPHKLRHQLGYDLIKKKVDIRYIKDILRHSSIASTQIYTQLSKDDLKDKLQEIGINDKRE